MLWTILGVVHRFSLSSSPGLAGGGTLTGVNAQCSTISSQLMIARSVLTSLADVLPTDQALAPVTALAWLGRTSPPLPPAVPAGPDVEVSVEAARAALSAAALVAADPGEALRIAQAGEALQMAGWR